MKELHVKSLLPVRLDKYLMEQYPALGPGRLNKALRENKIKLNGKKLPLSTRVQNGDVIRLFLQDEQLEARPLPTAVFVYEDNDILIANKPAGIEVDGPAADTLLKRVQATLTANGQPGHAVLCHRLDTGTSGLVLLAKNREAESFLTGAIKQRRIEKRYLCVTFGHPQPPAALLRGYLLKDAARGVVRVVSSPADGAREILTGYETLAVSGRLALLEVELITGRTHQIRAHLASIGCPILGDSKYGNNAANRELHFKYQALCAWELRFPTQIAEAQFAHLAGRVFHAEKPWYCNQITDGTLR
ncbi:MAG TPA: RluA family pseudouridine synthase [Candidatus Gemmiger excrementavium]|uniref:RNA pseudouridylate synthase n=1 Tax=Candidatus Gemmiger excrementavium TaxID=2838608 RepID=A0A9D2F2Z8_9FIRM|nr:RluA family pseudouridine synthase [Candidatus Gemmiger excrementavium]